MATQNLDFAKLVKIELVKRDWTFTDLAAAVNKKTGLFADQAYISRTLSGERNSPNIIGAIREILGIDEQAVSEHAVSAEGKD